MIQLSTGGMSSCSNEVDSSSLPTSNAPKKGTIFSMAVEWPPRRALIPENKVRTIMAETLFR